MGHQHQNNKPHTLRKGAALEHGEAHIRDHQNWSRRSFLQMMGLTGGGSMLMGSWMVNVLGSAGLQMALNSSESDRILVLIRLKGGNDGMNMIIPLYDYSRYQSLRPTIHVPQADLNPLSELFGLPKTMNKLRTKWLDGAVRVVNGVGYPDQNLSHFRSTDIWSSAGDANVSDTSGWLGRYLIDQYPDYLTKPPSIPPAIQIGAAGTLVFNDHDNNSLALSVSEPDELYEIAQNGQLYPLDNLPDCYYGEQLGWLRTLVNSTFIYADVVKKAYDISSNEEPYPNSSLGRQLALVARLIKGNLGTRLYMVTHDGFDTHADQQRNHPRLLQDLSDSVAAFYDDLAHSQLDRSVLGMTISEFGRRPQQNASNGCDHGAAAPLLLFGPGLNGNGFTGDGPSLRDLDESGNLKFNTDFRSVYASVLENWLCVDGVTVDAVLGRAFPRLDLGFACSPTAVHKPTAADFYRQVRYLPDGGVMLVYRLPQAAQVKVELYNILGQRVQTLFAGQQVEGEHQIHLPPGGLAAAPYVFRIEAGRVVASEMIRIVR